MTRESEARLIVATLGVFASLEGCVTGGQSGNEGAMRDHCVCTMGWTPGRGTVTVVDAERVTVLIDSWVDEGVERPAPLAPGEHVAGEWVAERECGQGVEIEVGDLVVFDARPDYEQCPAYVECGEELCGPRPEPDADEGGGDDVAAPPPDDWGECAASCLTDHRDACREVPECWQDGTIRLARWSAADDAWNFGAGTEGQWLIGDEDVGDVLADDEHCKDHFPWDPGCDTYVNGEPDC